MVLHVKKYIAYSAQGYNEYYYSMLHVEHCTKIQDLGDLIYKWPQTLNEDDELSKWYICDGFDIEHITNSY